MKKILVLNCVFLFLNFVLLLFIAIGYFSGAKKTDVRQNVDNIDTGNSEINGTISQIDIESNEQKGYVESNINQKHEDTLSALGIDFSNLMPVKNQNVEVKPHFADDNFPDGLDYSTGRSGDPVIAAMNGTIISVGYSSTFGINVIMQHANGIKTQYAHLSRAIVTRGQSVDSGTVIGYIGNTGITDGPHLYFSVFVNEKPVSPELLLRK